MLRVSRQVSDQLLVIRYIQFSVFLPDLVLCDGPILQEQPILHYTLNSRFGDYIQAYNVLNFR